MHYDTAQLTQIFTLFVKQKLISFSLIIRYKHKLSVSNTKKQLLFFGVTHAQLVLIARA